MKTNIKLARRTRTSIPGHVEKAVRICEAKFGNVYRWDGAALSLVAYDAQDLGRRRLLLYQFCKVLLRLNEFAVPLINLLLKIDGRGNVATGRRRFTLLGLDRSWLPRHVTSKSTRVKPSLRLG